mgnify:FL=1
MQLRPHHCITVPAVIAGVSYLLLAAVGLAGWPGEVGSSGMMFCEASSSGIIKQPANSWSNLGFTFAGLWVGFAAWQHFARGGDRVETNRFRNRIFYPTLYATVAAFVGPGSMALHASTTTWGGMIDLMSMFFWAVFALVYGLTRALELDDVRFKVTYLLVLAVVTALYLGVSGVGGGTPIFGVLVVLYAISEAWIFFRRPDLTADRRFLLGGVALFLIAFSIWLPSRTGGPLCDPHSLLQGHAIWHLLNAAAMVAFFLFYDSERRVASTAA